MTPLQAAAAQVGATDPAPFWAAVWPDHPAAAVDWCAVFVSACFASASEPLPQLETAVRSGFAWCPDAVGWARSHGQWVTGRLQPGDVVFYCWDGSGVAEHTGIVVADDGVTLTTVEGNTTPDGAGPVGVWQRHRPHTDVLGAWRTGAPMTRTLYDSTNVADIPADATMVAGYVDGKWATFPALAARFPHAVRVSITVFGWDGTGKHVPADVCDCESGDLTAAQAARWAREETQAGRQPTIYCSLSAWSTVKAAVAAVGAGPVSYWIADYDGSAVIPAGAVAKQYRSDTNQNLDYSIVADYWPGVDSEDNDMTAQESADLATVKAQVAELFHWIGETGNSTQERVTRMEADIRTLLAHFGLPAAQ